MAEHGALLEERLGTLLAGRCEIEHAPRPRDLTVRLAGPAELPVAAAELAGPAGMSLATLIATDEQEAEEGLSVRYVFEPAVGVADEPLLDQFVTLLVTLDPARPELPSLTSAIPAANWHEREAQDLLGIVALGHPDPRPLVLHDGWPAGLHPLRKSFDLGSRPPREAAPELPHLIVEGEGVFEIPVGPIHAGIIEPGHFRFSAIGETVIHLDARLFYTHRGLEKRIEGMSAVDGFFVAERICGVCSVSHGLGFCEVVEQIAGMGVPNRARIIRTVALELERLYNHVGDIGNICAGASYHYGTSAGLRIKETLQRLNEKLAGNRFLRGLLIPGGIARDVSPELAETITAVLLESEEALADLMHRIATNPSVVDRFDGTGILPRQTALDLAVTGVAARASGVARDARRDHPHAAFADALDEPATRIERVTRTEGDVHARVKMRGAEAHESIRLIRLLLARLEPGPLAAPVPEALPPGRIGLASIESPRGACVHWLRSDARGRIDRYHLRSASYANWPAVALAALGGIVPDFPLINKSFELCYSCTDR